MPRNSAPRKPAAGGKKKGVLPKKASKGKKEAMPKRAKMEEDDFDDSDTVRVYLNGFLAVYYIFY